MCIIAFSYQKRVDTVSLNERRRNQEREQVKRGWLPGEGLCLRTRVTLHRINVLVNTEW